MAIRLTCPSCRTLLEVDDHLAGQTVRCGDCGATARAPAAPPRPRPAVPLDPDAASADDPHDPRRRRRPVPRESGSRVVWGCLFAVGGLGLLAVGGVVAVCVWLAQPSWESHDRDGFRVELPKPPQNMKALAARHKGGAVPANVQMFGTVLMFPSEEFAVIHTEIDPWKRRTATDAQILADAVAGMKADEPNAEVLADGPAAVSGLPAREVVLRSPTDGTVVCRMVVADTRLYLVLAGGPEVTAENERVRRFVDSFEVTDERRLAAVKARADAARQAGERAEREKAEREQAERDRAARVAAQQKAAKDRADAAEKAAKDRADAAEKAAREADAFWTAAYDGPPPPDPAAVPGLSAHLRFDADGLPPERSLVRPGPGPRGTALYLARGGATTLTDVTIALGRLWNDDYTVGLWVRVRAGTTGELFHLDHRAASTSELRVGVTADRLVVSRAVAGTKQLTTDRPADDRWHHLLVVRRLLAGGREGVTLYVDGEAAGTDSWPHAQVRTAAVARVGPFRRPESDPRAPAAAVDELCVYGRAATAAEARFLAGRLSRADLDAARRAEAVPPADPVVPKPPAPKSPPSGPAAEVAPPPRAVVASNKYAGRPVPAASDLPGLKVYLPLDAVADGRTTEAVSGKPAGRAGAGRVEVTDGVRGAALRLTTAAAARKVPTLDLSDLKDALRADANKPFTLALWTRRPDPAKAVGTTFSGTAQVGRDTRKLDVNGVGSVVVLQMSEPNAAAPGGLDTVTLGHATGRPGEWAHVAVVRDAGGAVHLWVNGAESPQRARAARPMPAAVAFDRVGLGESPLAGMVVDVDELCLFDRALSADELKTLAGKP